MENQFNNENSLTLGVKEENIMEKVNQTRQLLLKNPEVIALSKSLDVNNPQAILDFGKEPAEKISSFADKILHNIKSNSIEDSNKMLKQLNSILTKFDKKDFVEEEGFFSKIFNSSKNKIEKLLNKYKTIGGEIDNIYKEIVKYEQDIKNMNENLDNMYEENIMYYQELEKHIVAATMALEEIEKEDLPYFADLAQSGDEMAKNNYQKILTIVEVLKQRIYDLEMAKIVSLQTAPQIKLIQKGNYKLISKIHSAFIVTIPVFKNSMIQAITLKKQKMIADSMEALDKTTNELLLRNAQNIKDQTIEIAKLTTQPSIKLETIEQSWNTIMDGIKETLMIEEENKKIKEQTLQKIQSLEFQNKKTSI